MASCIAKCFDESSFHGVQYIFQRRLHLIEKCFWFGITSCAVFFAVEVSLTEWWRYVNSPTVHAIENNYQNWRFPNVGVTICPNYMDTNKSVELISRFWNVTKKDENFGIYLDFLTKLSKLTFKSMTSLEPFSKYNNLNNADFLALTREMKSTYGLINKGQYATVITDMGICFTNSEFNEIQNSNGVMEYINITKRPECHFYLECQTDIFTPSFVGNLYIHELRDVLTSNHSGHVKLRFKNGTNGGSINIILTQFVAHREVRNLPVHIRKCYFFDESILPHFDKYTPALCLINCRTKAALKACGCKPFFYTVGNGPVCNITGMLCLSKANWFYVSCNCWELCSGYKYIFVSKRSNNIKGFQNALEIKIKLPNIRISKRVIFSLDQFVVSIGGTASFFLGCSFISFVEIIYFVLEIIANKVKAIFCRGKSQY